MLVEVALCVSPIHFCESAHRFLDGTICLYWDKASEKKAGSQRSRSVPTPSFLNGSGLLWTCSIDIDRSMHALSS